MKKFLITLIVSLLTLSSNAQEYIPTDENLRSRQEFADAGLGIFLHWGLYSMMAQGEWYLNYGIDAQEYAKMARAFYPADFDAAAWVKAFKDAGAKYICLTSRHHDGFSMWHTQQSDYNIVDATPFGRDILKELSDECQKQGLRLHLYYSHLDWTRPDYPQGRTGHTTGRDPSQADWDSYLAFMKNQLTELLTQYGPIGAIWFDGWWDHDEDSVPFDWHLREQYDLIHSLQPRCLVINNHHQSPFPGEDAQTFERDVPGENEAGLSGQEISRLPLETCQTMNGMWGYKIADQNYKSTHELIRLMLRTRGKGANLLINIGPQSNGELPALALDRLQGIGEWLRRYGDTFYATTAADFDEQPWGVATVKKGSNKVGFGVGDKMYLHIINPVSGSIGVPTSFQPTSAHSFDTGEEIPFETTSMGLFLNPGTISPTPDYIIILD